MADSLHVIALISGGKDSFFSLLHCIQNGHQVVALGNLFPAPPAPAAAGAGTPPAPRRPDAAVATASNHEADGEDEQDLNSFMYQTVGHTVIPLYEQALGIPLYRQPIVGSAVQTGTSYGYADVGSTGSSCSSRPGSGSSDVGTAKEGFEVKHKHEEEEDETESLVPLLKRIMAKHPTANALSTGAILSTYQRTRVESVAIRLGLTPLSYLWQYPILPPGTQTSLLEDMQAIGLDARIVKVASGGLDESFLWQNVADQQVMRRIEKSMKRFGTDGDGAVLGEGGEFETLVVGGPGSLFKGRIVVEEKDRKVVREGGGSAWLKILEARVVMKESEEVVHTHCRTPELLESRFTSIIASLNNKEVASLNSKGSYTQLKSPILHSPKPLVGNSNSNSILHWTVTAKQAYAIESISTQASKAIEEIRYRLHQASLQPTDIISTVIILRSMQDFASINKVYGALFTKPNPPSRVTISCGTLLPEEISLIIHLSTNNTPSSPTSRKALHVQSRSYWAPANIGPYSQAICITLPSTTTSQTPTSLVSIAGQIPLVPHTMNLPLRSSTQPTTSLQNQEGQEREQEFKLQALLSLQHLLRITREMHISWLSSCVAYLPSSTNTPSLPSMQKSQILAQAWRLLHQRPNQDDEDDIEGDESRDLWEEKHYAGMEIRGAVKDKREYPLWDLIDCSTLGEDTKASPPFWTVEVEELPRGSMVEWAAGVGVVGSGSVKLTSSKCPKGWKIHQCSFSSKTISIIMLEYSPSLPSINDKLEDIFSSLGGAEGTQAESSAAYVDISISGLWERWNFGGAVPCRSIWDSEGRRLACVVLFDDI